MSQLQNHFETIADQLAEKGVSCIDSFLNIQEIEGINGLEIVSGDFSLLKKAGVGKVSKQINEGIRGDFIMWIDKTTCHQSLKLYLDKLDELRLFLNKSLFLSLKDLEVHIARYPIGAYYKRHLDQFKRDDHRKLSVICYLNVDWKESDGGQLRMYLPDQTLDLLPMAGRLVCFRSDLIEHEVLPAYRERRALTGWMLDQMSDLRYF